MNNNKLDVLNASVERYQEIIDLSPDGIIVLDASWRITLFSKGAQDMFGYTADEVIGQSFNSLILFDNESKDENVNVPPDTNQFDLIKRRDVSIARKGNPSIPVEMHMSRSKIKDDSRIYTVILRDISERKAREEKLQWMANHDVLTEIYNRRAFYQYLEQEIQRGKRDKMKFALLYLDIDDFKGINDEYGHHVGDTVLKRFSKQIKKTVREVDIVARLSGDEFIVILHNIENPNAAALVSEKIVNLFKGSFSSGDIKITSTVSIGISIYPTDATHSNELVKCADVALYKAKTKGKNRYAFYADNL